MQIKHRVSPRANIDRRQRELGASLVEYALLVALIAVVCIAAVTFLGNGGKGALNKAGTGIGGSGVEGFAAYQQETDACRAAGGYVSTSHTGSPTGSTYLLTCSGGSAPGTFNYDLTQP